MTVENSKCIQANAFIQTGIFQEFTFKDDTATFRINLNTLMVGIFMCKFYLTHLWKIELDTVKVFVDTQGSYFGVGEISTVAWFLDKELFCSRVVLIFLVRLKIALTRQP